MHDRRLLLFVRVHTMAAENETLVRLFESQPNFWRTALVSVGVGLIIADSALRVTFINPAGSVFANEKKKGPYTLREATRLALVEAETPSTYAVSSLGQSRA